MGKRLLVAVLCAAAVTGVGATGALAGEITGNGKWIAGSETAPLKGNSECAYSGRNDENVLFEPGDPDYQAQRAQSWGQVIRGMRPVGGFGGFNPGLFCNGSGK